MKAPQKPEGDRESITLTEHGITLESPTPDEFDGARETPPGEGEEDPEKFRQFLQQTDERFCEIMWHNWMDVLMSHRIKPIELFKTRKTQIAGHEAHIVYKTTHGHKERPVLKRSKRFTDHIIDAGKSVCLQYAITSDRTPAEVCKDVPFDFFPFEIMRVREFVEEHEMVWANFEGRNWWDRTWIGTDYELRGVLYVMYTMGAGKIEPRYIGLSQKYSRDGELNWNFTNVTSDSVLCRWGYGKSSHLGELSCAMWPDDYPWEPSRKYRQWIEALFLQDTRVLNKPVYVEVLPWLSDELVHSEENLIMLADVVFDTLLNTEYTGQVDLAQEELP